MKTVDQFADEQDKILPAICPNCGQELNQIRYFQQRDETRIHLTGKLNSHEYFGAECPSCKQRLATETIRKNQDWFR